MPAVSSLVRLENFTVCDILRGMSKRQTTAEVIREYLIREDRDGRLHRSKLAEKIGVGSSMVTMILKRDRKFPMDRIDEVSEFFRLAPDQFIALVRREMTPEETQRTTATSDSAGSGFPKRRKA